MSEETKEVPPAPTSTKSVNGKAQASETHEPTPQVSMTSEALKARLDEERSKGVNKLLKSLGVDKEDDLRAIIKLAKDLEAEKLSEKEKLTKELEETKRGAERAKTLESLAQKLFDEQWENLPDKVKEAISSAAGDSFDERVRLYQVMKAAGIAGGKAEAVAEGEAKPKGKAAPANQGTAPPAPASKAAKTKWDEFQTLEQTNPAMAAIFFEANRFEIEKSRPADQ